MTDTFETKLAVLDNLSKKIEEIQTVDDGIELMARAEALRAYVKEIGAGLDVQNRASEFKLRVQRKTGGVLIDMKNRGELWAGGDTTKLPTTNVTSLEKLGIHPRDSSGWQYLYKLDASVFEKGITDIWSENRELTTWGLYNWAKSYTRPKTEPKEKQKTYADAFHKIQEHFEAIRGEIKFLEAGGNNGGGYYLRNIVQILTEMAVELVRKGFNNVEPS